jgi:hypothetical protein
MCVEYSELLYFANKSVNEIKELELVKNALNERYKRYYKTTIQMEKELDQLKRTNLKSNSMNESFKIYQQGLESGLSSFSSNEVMKMKEMIEVIINILILITL